MGLWAAHVGSEGGKGPWGPPTIALHILIQQRDLEMRAPSVRSTHDGCLTLSLVCEIASATDVGTGREPRHSVSGLPHLIQL